MTECQPTKSFGSLKHLWLPNVNRANNPSGRVSKMNCTANLGQFKKLNVAAIHCEMFTLTGDNGLFFLYIIHSPDLKLEQLATMLDKFDIPPIKCVYSLVSA